MLTRYLIRINGSRVDLVRKYECLLPQTETHFHSFLWSPGTDGQKKATALIYLMCLTHGPISGHIIAPPVAVLIHDQRITHTHRHHTHTLTEAQHTRHTLNTHISHTPVLIPPLPIFPTTTSSNPFTELLSGAKNIYFDRFDRFSA